jgi:AraC-like DNA-binding protein
MEGASDAMIMFLTLTPAEPTMSDSSSRIADGSSSFRPHDALSGVLDLVRMRGLVLFAAELSAPWGVRTAGFDDLACYIVLRGAAHLSAADTEVALGAGDVALVASRTPHRLSDARGRRAVAFEELPRPSGEGGMLRLGRGGATTSMLCGCLRFDRGGQEIVATALPTVVHLAAEHAFASHMNLVHALWAELIRSQPGGRAVLTRLAEALFIQALRACARDGGTRATWLRALNQPQLARALAAVHADPAAPWTVETLAQRAGMSRSGFATAFHRAVGEPPLSYITKWRMGFAARLLDEGVLALREIAGRVGYGSSEAFSRAFSRWAGTPPGEYRRQGGC